MDAAPLDNDKLAAAYLKSRDLPCPSCGYNRRDGETSICPECEHDLAIVHEDGGWKQQFTGFASRYLMMLMVLGSIFTLHLCHSVYSWLGFWMDKNAPRSYAYFFLTLCTFGLIMYFAVFLLSVSRWRGIRKGKAYTPKQLARPMLLYIIVALLLAIAKYFTVLL